MVDLKKINEELKLIDENLFISNSVEDYCEQDMVEYGIQDIEETRHLSLQYWNRKGIESTLIKDYFNFSEPRSLMFSETQKHTMKHLGLNNETILDIIALFWNYSK